MSLGIIHASPCLIAVRAHVVAVAVADRMIVGDVLDEQPQLRQLCDERVTLRLSFFLMAHLIGTPGLAASAAAVRSRSTPLRPLRVGRDRPPTRHRPTDTRRQPRAGCPRLLLLRALRPA